MASLTDLPVGTFTGSAHLVLALRLSFKCAVSSAESLNLSYPKLPPPKLRLLLPWWQGFYEDKKELLVFHRGEVTLCFGFADCALRSKNLLKKATEWNA